MDKRLYAYENDGEENATISVRSGMSFDVLNPTADKILIEDIAHSLSMQCRFAGHTSEFFSVAQHSIICSLMAPPGFELEALLHDASEAYLQDIARPVKRKLSNYASIENKVMYTIAVKFCFNWPLSKEVKKVDEESLRLEFDCFISNTCDALKPMAPAVAKAAFLERFYNLYHK